MQPGQEFYSTSLRQTFTREDVLAGRVIRISPALITLTDGRMTTTPPDDLRREVTDQVVALLDHGVRSFHVDINFDDYSRFGSSGPDHNAALFTPEFVRDLNQFVLSRGGYITLHLLTDHPDEHLRDFESIPLGAVCFQLDVIQDSNQLAALIRQIHDMGACASPVIETVGTDHQLPRSEIEVRALLDRCCPRSVADLPGGAAARSNLPSGAFARDQVAATIDCLRPGFNGTIQIQGITIVTRSGGQAGGRFSDRRDAVISGRTRPIRGYRFDVTERCRGVNRMRELMEAINLDQLDIHAAEADIAWQGRCSGWLTTGSAAGSLLSDGHIDVVSARKGPVIRGSPSVSWTGRILNWPMLSRIAAGCGTPSNTIRFFTARIHGSFITANPTRKPPPSR
jgi:hypothetical protein